MSEHAQRQQDLEEFRAVWRELSPDQQARVRDYIHDLSAASRDRT